MTDKDTVNFNQKNKKNIKKFFNPSNNCENMTGNKNFIGETDPP